MLTYKIFGPKMVTITTQTHGYVFKKNTSLWPEVFS
jgi:hypothetical protein